MIRTPSTSSSASPVRLPLQKSLSLRPLHDHRDSELLEDHQWKNILNSIHTKVLLHVNARIIKNTLLTKRIEIGVFAKQSAAHLDPSFPRAAARWSGQFGLI